MRLPRRKQVDDLSPGPNLWIEVTKTRIAQKLCISLRANYFSALGKYMTKLLKIVIALCYGIKIGKKIWTGYPHVTFFVKFSIMDLRYFALNVWPKWFFVRLLFPRSFFSHFLLSMYLYFRACLGIFIYDINPVWDLLLSIMYR